MATRPCRILLLSLAVVAVTWPIGAQEPLLTPEDASTGEITFQNPQADEKPADDLPRGARSGMFQKAMFDGTWLPQFGDDGLGMVDLELKTVLAVPCPTRQWPLLIIPGVAMHFLDAPQSADLPEHVYDAYVMFRWLPKINDKLMFDVAVTPGVYRDFEHDTADGLRVTMHGAGIWTLTPELKLVAGVMYLDRRDWNVLPLGGLIWNPTKDWSFDILFPQPKASRRVHCFGATGDDMEDWFYVAGEFADNVWAIERTGGVHDRIAYRDTRLLLGFERKVIGGVSGKVEVGYVFSRKISYYDTATPDFVPSDTLFLRAGVSY
jgi:hypothetical protein